MYEVIVSMKSVGTYLSFKQAFTVFYESIKKVLEKGTSYQWLETTNFLVNKNDPEIIQLMNFYEGRDSAYRLGLLVDGKIQADIAEPAPELVSREFEICTGKRNVTQTESLIFELGQILQHMN
jgi:hypothetical protein